MSVTEPVAQDAVARREAVEPEGNAPSDLSEETVREDDPEKAPQAELKEVDVQPDGGYGWVVVACCFLM
jgi:hypothetical protein